MTSSSDVIAAGTRVVVTGASGFIGGRLTERLLALGADVTCLVRGSTVPDRLERAGARFHTIDLADVRDVGLALEGAEIVFHCAYDWGNERWNVAAIRALIDGMRTANCARLVHLSSFVVYAIPERGDVAEESAQDASSGGYAFTKREIESELLRAAATRDRAISVAILQPTIVYGPRSKPWTIDPAMELLRGEVLLPVSGEGLCNAVYVDDVVAAMILAARHDGAAGKRFLITGPEPITWTSFYAGLAKELGTAGPTYISAEDIAKERSRLRKLVRIVRDPNRLAGRLVRDRRVRQVLAILKSALGRRTASVERPASPQTSLAAKKRAVDMPNFGRLEFLQSRAVVSSAKAIHEIGYDPQFSFAAGLDATAEFLRELKNRAS